MNWAGLRPGGGGRAGGGGICEEDEEAKEGGACCCAWVWLACERICMGDTRQSNGTVRLDIAPHSSLLYVQQEETLNN